MPFDKPSHANADIRTLADLLLSTPIGEICTYSQMTEAIGAPIQRCRHFLYKAMKVANQEAGAVFAVVIEEGQKRLPSQDAHLVGHAARKLIRRKSRRSSATIGRAIECANDLREPERRKAYAEINSLMMIEFMAKDRTVRTSAPDEKPEPVAKTLRKTLERMGVALPPPGQSSV